jgi:DNA-directed RNA polymerase specialized sigma24 family protein
MQDRRIAPPPLWISETDEHGNRVSPEVLGSAQRIWSRVLRHLHYLQQDTAPAAEILEAACHSVSRSLRRKREQRVIRDLDSYLFWAFVRKHNRGMIREGRIQYVESLESITDVKTDSQGEWVAALEQEIHLKQLVCYLDERTRNMLMYRIWGDSWADIGKRFGISAHNAEVQFANGIKRSRSRLGNGLGKTGQEQP